MSDFVEDLKKVKVPLWARWLGYWRARQRRRAARKEVYHIATLTSWTWLTFHNRYSRTWFLLKQAGDGKRFFEVQCQDSFLRDSYKATHVYVHVVEPWRLGRYTNAVIQEWAAKQKEPETGG